MFDQLPELLENLPRYLGGHMLLSATALGVLALPLLFPAPLPRYMLPGLPLLCALAALGLDALVVRRRALVLAAPA